MKQDLALNKVKFEWILDLGNTVNIISKEHFEILQIRTNTTIALNPAPCFSASSSRLREVGTFLAEIGLDIVVQATIVVADQPLSNPILGSETLLRLITFSRHHGRG